MVMMVFFGQRCKMTDMERQRLDRTLEEFLRKDLRRDCRDEMGPAYGCDYGRLFGNLDFLASLDPVFFLACFPSSFSRMMIMRLDINGYEWVYGDC